MPRTPRSLSLAGRIRIRASAFRPALRPTAVRRAARSLLAAAILAALAPAALPSAGLGAQEPDPEPWSELGFRHIGPEGNRAVAVAGVPGDPLVYYAGAATGGVWKTEDGGTHWRPTFDHQPVGSIGALAVAPSDPMVVWAGTGESFLRSNVSVGNGLYRSTDGGVTWVHAGPDVPSRIGRIVIHPRDPDVVYAAFLGHAHGPQQERGVYRTTDGGETWERVLFVDETTGASDLVMDPNNPRKLFAGTWQVAVHQWGRESGGPGGGIHVSRDGGGTWNRLEGNGLPQGPVGKVALCMTADDSDRIYALIETGDGVPHGQLFRDLDEESEAGRKAIAGELWRSDDGGESWELASHDRDLAGRTAYYSRCAVSPDDADEAYFLAASFSVTRNGGETNTETEGRAEPGFDHHDMWIDPTDGDRMIVSHDGGVSISVDRGKSWRRVELPIAQLYHVTVDTNVPYHVYGNRQDGPSVRGPSNNRQFGFFGGGITRGEWHGVGGGESGFATPDPVDPDVVWSSASGAGAAGGIVVRYDERTRQFRHVEVWPESTMGWPAEGLRYRFQWTFPLLISPHDHETVYVTSQHVHRTRNGGQSWEVVSPDLTTDDEARQGISGGLTPDNIGVEYCCVIYAFDESPVEEGVLWAGTNDGLVHVSRDGGESWTDVTGNIPDLPPLGVVRNMDASRWDAGKAYLSVEFHFTGNFDPYIYRTEDYGQSWTRITDGIPPSATSYVRNVREDPARPGLLYAGTESALYVSFDDGASWRSLQNNLPPTPMYWIQVQEHFDDLVVGTYGRGIWILDDVTPLQQWTAEVRASETHLFEPRAAYRFRPVTENMFVPNDPTAGENPEYGASLHYWVRAVPEGDTVEAKLAILDAAGDTVRVLTDTAAAGINRVWWDLRGEETTEVELRTPPLHAPDIEVGDDGERPLPGGFGGGGFAILQPPGTYTVTLRVEGEEVGRRELEVRKDPNSEGTAANIGEQVALLREIHADQSAASEMINRIELVRRQLAELGRTLDAVGQDSVEVGQDSVEAAPDFAEAGPEAEAGPRAGAVPAASPEAGGLAELEEAARALDEKLIGIEEQLFQMRLTGEGQDRLRFPTRLHGKLSYLAGTVATADFPPTDQAREVHALLRERLRAHQAELEEALEEDLALFNERLRARGLPNVIAGAPEE